MQQLWISSDFYKRQKLQCIFFHDGMQFYQDNDAVLIYGINSLFGKIVSLVSVSAENKKGDLVMDCLLEVMSGMTTAGSNLLLNDIARILQY